MFLGTRGLGASASGLVTRGAGIIAELARGATRTAKKTHKKLLDTIEKTKEYYVSAILMSVNDDEINNPQAGSDYGQISNKQINTSAILIKINHMKLFLERIFISAGNKIGIRKHKKNLKDYRRKL